MASSCSGHGLELVPVIGERSSPTVRREAAADAISRVAIGRFVARGRSDLNAIGLSARA
jgi:hypothetical protein